MDKDIDLIRVVDRMSVIKAMVQESIISVISVYVLHCGFKDSQNDDFSDNLNTVNGKVGKNEIAVIAGTSIVTFEAL